MFASFNVRGGNGALLDLPLRDTRSCLLVGSGGRLVSVGRVLDLVLLTGKTRFLDPDFAFLRRKGTPSHTDDGGESGRRDTGQWSIGWNVDLTVSNEVGAKEDEGIWRTWDVGCGSFLVMRWTTRKVV